MTLRAIFSLTLVIVFSLFSVPAVSAHSTEPRIEISLERFHPGEVVNVRGVNFGMDETITLALLGTDTEILLGDVSTDAEGVFVYIVALPVDLAEGTYHFRAVDDHHSVLSPTFTVWGATVEEGGGQGLRDEDDGLLAPMPTFAPAAVTVPAPAASMFDPMPTTRLPGWNENALIGVGFGLFMIMLAMNLRKKRKIS